ncbi:hypothetical protein HanPI659440_Chr17g0694911 [Helianthus annuus]|uniref:Erythronate-4-phosphate dehydrogenase family protein n=1 Tax=Helianthus annuus TaxID=4232 RepID=A0A251RSZ9_HELAN|nr:uncharacterized protein At1g01500 [Helianthus annuus]KAF5756886.1 hypothetical protein HanXRQr2_Chr17g0820211 [Helianthus annuus]KAJ0435168.1 hypothetical protein HanIR_Chr17g0890361 [Helianthus annuus]KAJ0668900.1 hypothetical protein HanPI659440_Chr17g0694911 [Helianthus annuus]KAJ0814586.1 hypothetical protein HanPSC8_Chr17g0787441 [Helianthus annuus]
MDQNHKKPFNFITTNGSGDIHVQTTSGWLEIRLFYVRITPCAVNAVPVNLTLRNLRREIGVSLEINGVRVPSTNTGLVTLRRDRVDKESSEVTYVSTDNVRVSGAVEFEVVNDELDDREMVLCGSLERIEPMWNNSGSELKKGWSMDFYAGNLAKFGGFSTSVEVYIAGCCSSVPVILTKTVLVSPRRRGSRCGMLDAIPEDEEVDKEMVRENGVVRQRKLAHTGEEGYEYESEVKLRPSYYSEEMYYDEDGQLTWFNAGVRVGVGIGLGMCLGIGVGVGLLMRSYQATTRNFRRFF